MTQNNILLREEALSTLLRNAQFQFQLFPDEFMNAPIFTLMVIFHDHEPCLHSLTLCRLEAASTYIILGGWEKEI